MWSTVCPHRYFNYLFKNHIANLNINIIYLTIACHFCHPYIKIYRSCMHCIVENFKTHCIWIYLTNSWRFFTHYKIRYSIYYRFTMICGRLIISMPLLWNFTRIYPLVSPVSSLDSLLCVCSFWTWKDLWWWGVYILAQLEQEVISSAMLVRTVILFAGRLMIMFSVCWWNLMTYMHCCLALISVHPLYLPL